MPWSSRPCRHCEATCSGVFSSPRSGEVPAPQAQESCALAPPGFYGTDAAHLYRMGGMAGVVCGPGGRYNTMPDERVDIDDYLDMVRIYILTILRICG